MTLDEPVPPLVHCGKKGGHKLHTWNDKDSGKKRRCTGREIDRVVFTGLDETRGRQG